MEVTTDALFAIIGELFVQTRMQSRMLQQAQLTSPFSSDGNKPDAITERTIPDYQAWRKEHPDSVEQQNREGPGSQSIPPGERL